MKAILSLALFFSLGGTSCYGITMTVTAVRRPDLVAISGGSDLGIQNGHAMAVIRHGDDSVTYIGKFEVILVNSYRSICRALSVVPGVFPQRGDDLIPIERLSSLLGQVTSAPSNGEIEVSFPRMCKGDRLRVYRETPAGIAEVGRVKVVMPGKDRSVCTILPESLQIPIRPGDRVVEIFRWRVQSVDKDTVTVPVGAEDGVSKGRRFWVFRSSGCVPTYAGKIEVVKVGAESCVCQVLAEARELAVEKGDTVTREELIPPRIEGTVVGLPQPDMVEVNVGSDQKLRKDDLLTVLCTDNGKSRFVAQITVVRSTPEKSVCHVNRGMQTAPIQIGDKVRTW